VYSPVVDGKRLKFGHEGILYRRSFIMYDKGTHSLWVHTTGECVKGELKGKTLEFLPSTVTTWKRWKELHPQTTVLTGKRANQFMGHFGLQEKPNDYGLSVGQGKAPKLYPYKLLHELTVLNDEHEGTPIVVLLDKATGIAKAYERGKRTFVWKAGKLLDDTGKEWVLVGAYAKDDPKTRLQEAVGTQWTIQRWKGFYPNGPLYKAAD
jgi:hypothetical protein